jgi:hypothetical protein
VAEVLSLHAEISDEERAAWTASTPLAWATSPSPSPSVRRSAIVYWSEDGCWYKAANPIFGPGEPLEVVPPGADFLDATAPIVR